MANSSSKIQRYNVTHFDGLCRIVGDHISKPTELSHVENCTSDTIGEISKRSGTRRLGNAITSTRNCGIFYFANTITKGFYRICTVGGVTSIYYVSNLGVWTALIGSGTNLTVSDDYPQFSSTIASDKLFLVNGTNNNLEISGTDGTTVTTSASTSSHLYGSPKAKLINYYKDRIYAGDYFNASSVEIKNGIMQSSVPLGIVAKVDGNPTLPVSSLDVTDTKYIRTSDSLDVYRVNVKIGVLTVTAKTETTITATIAYEAGQSDVLSSDDLWVTGTYTGEMKHRWADNPTENGIDIKQYDTLRVSGGQNDALTMMVNIGNVMLISTKNNIVSINGSNSSSWDVNVGCVSKRGWVKKDGKLYFLSYNGIYETTGSGAPKLISTKVSPYFAGATKAGLEAGAMGAKGDSIYAAIGTVTLYNPDGSVKKTLSNDCVEYNTITTNFFNHTGIKATQFETYRETSGYNRLIYESTETGLHCFELFTGDMDDKVTSDKEIPFVAETGDITLGKNFEDIVSVHEIVVESKRGASLQCFISVDGGEFYQVKGDIRKGITTLKITAKNDDSNQPVKLNKINISFRDSSAQLCKISRFAILYQPTNEQVLKNN